MRNIPPQLMQAMSSPEWVKAGFAGLLFLHTEEGAKFAAELSAEPFSELDFEAETIPALENLAHLAAWAEMVAVLTQQLEIQTPELAGILPRNIVDAFHRTHQQLSPRRLELDAVLQRKKAKRDKILNLWTSPELGEYFNVAEVEAAYNEMRTPTPDWSEQ